MCSLRKKVGEKGMRYMLIAIMLVSLNFIARAGDVKIRWITPSKELKVEGERVDIDNYINTYIIFDYFIKNKQIMTTELLGYHVGIFILESKSDENIEILKNIVKHHDDYDRDCWAIYLKSINYIYAYE